VALIIPILPAQEPTGNAVRAASGIENRTSAGLDSIPIGQRVEGRIESLPGTRRHAPRWLALWHLASLDAPTVAVVWSLGFAWIAGVSLPHWTPALLALAVWSAYVIDRLLDARSGLRSGDPGRLRDRHFFHWRHRRVLLPMAGMAAGAATLLVLRYVPALLRERDSVLAAVSVAYFARVHSGSRSRPFLSRLFTKELLVGVLFTIGCALPALGRLPPMPRVAHWAILGALAFFAQLAWLNCHAIDSWESETIRRGRSPILLKSCLTAATGIVLCLLIFIPSPRAAAMAATGASSALLLAWLDCRRSRLSPVALRALADVALLAPAALVPIGWLLR
jgi:hypothetical protein